MKTSNVEGNVSTGSHAPPDNKPTPAEWERIKPLVKELYIDKDVPVPAIVPAVKAKLGRENIHITTQMLKYRIVRWHLDTKYLKKSDILACFRKMRQRQAEGKASIFHVHKRVMTPDDIYQYLDKKGVDLSAVPEANEDDARLWATGKVRCQSPPPSTSDSAAVVPIPRSGISTMQTDIGLTFLKSIDDYFAGLFTPEYLNAMNSGDLSCHQASPLEFGGEFLKYHTLTVEGRQDEAWIVLGTTFRMIKPLLRMQHPRLLVYLLESIAFSRSTGHGYVARQLIDFFRQACMHELNTPTHSLLTFVSSLHFADDTTLAGIIESGLQCMAAQFDASLGAHHRETMSLMLTSSAILKHQGSFYQASDFLAKLLGRYEHTYGVNSYEASHALSDHAAVKTEMRQFVEAGRLLQDAMTRAPFIQDPTQRCEAMIRNMLNLALYHKAEGNIEYMVRTLQGAQRIGREGLLGDDHWTTSYLASLIATAPPVPTAEDESDSQAVFESSDSASSVILTPSGQSSSTSPSISSAAGLGQGSTTS